MWAVALRTVSDPEEAADALQDAFLAAFRDAGRFRGDAAVTTWLHRIVVNACLDRVRRRAARPSVSIQDDAAVFEAVAPRAADPISAHEATLDITAALQQIPYEQRAALVLVDLMGYAVEDAATVLAVPPGTVKSRAAHGRARLAPLLLHLRNRTSTSLAAREAAYYTQLVARAGNDAPTLVDVGPRHRQDESQPMTGKSVSPGMPEALGADDKRLYFSAQMPMELPAAAEFSLIVRITRRPPRGEVMAPMPPLSIPARGLPVTVILQTPWALTCEESLQQVILVEESGEPPPIRFALRSRETGLHTVRVTAWSGGTFLCELALEISVSPSGRRAEGPLRVARIDDPRSNPGEVTLQITSSDERFVFQLISDSYLGRSVHAESLIAEPGAAVERVIDTLRAMAVGRSGYTGSNRFRWIREAGVGLWNEMVPQAIKEEFWQVHSNISTLSIAADDGIVPWELLYPLAPGHDEGFLVEQFPVLRRTQGQSRRSLLTALDPRFVISANCPGNAREEIASIQRIVGPGDTLDQLDLLLELLDSGSADLLHFACHNHFEVDGGSQIRMGGGPFAPSLLNSAVNQRTLAKSSPLVFMNACRTTGAVPQWTQMAGWAQQFMAAGAGAFIGTLWAVRSESAAAFAESFYSTLRQADQTLGSAVHNARNAARTSRTPDDDLSWLAYSVSGNPSASITMGAPS